MSLNLKKFTNLNARIDFNTLASAGAVLSNRAGSLEEAIMDVMTNATDPESDTYEDNLIVAEKVQNILASSGLESTIISLFENVEAVAAVVEELRTVTGQNSNIV